MGNFGAIYAVPIFAQIIQNLSPIDAGFMMFPADRDPPFRTGPFTPTTVATNPNIQGLNPITFGLSNIFRR